MIVQEVRRLPDPPSGQVTVLGIDEFTFRKSATYGTLLIDVATRRPIDLLPDRTADTVAAWLADRPGIKVICRGRCSTFSQAAARAAPMRSRLQIAGDETVSSAAAPPSTVTPCVLLRREALQTALRLRDMPHRVQAAPGPSVLSLEFCLDVGFRYGDGAAEGRVGADR
ncbi:transposase [Streptomyces sp. NPDC057271]|uniref:transposase n=1 Tax=unclassified Streptomyces TaxID=2593676 RepID=UPI00363F988B